VPRRAWIALGVTLGVALLFLGVSQLPSATPLPEKKDPVVRLQIGPRPNAPATGLLDQREGGLASGLRPAMSLIAANGAVISDPALVEMTSEGPLPRIGSDGRLPMVTYARKVDTKETRPRIALVVSGLGISPETTTAMLDGLPPGVTLGFSPYGENLQGLVSLARGNGNEVVLELPLEPYDFPNTDPGPNTLLAGASAASNGTRLRWLLTRFTGYAGLLGSEGGKFLSNASDVRMLIDAIKGRGLYFADNGASDQSVARDASRAAGAHFVRVDFRVDANPSRDLIEKSLLSLEKVAMMKGTAIGITAVYPGTAGQISAWANELEQKGFALVPLSALLSPSLPSSPGVEPSKAEADAKPVASPPAVLRRSNESDPSRATEAPSPHKDGDKPKSGVEPAHEVLKEPHS
jgi:polysaccharide deacetylase 2 family uncharacterized protein YibQ